MADSPKPPPIEEIRIGTVKAAIWKNDTKGGVYYNVTFSRLYRTDEGDWRESSSFGRHDLLALAKVADDAHTRVLELRGELEGDDG